MGTKFSIFQEIYVIDEDLIINIKDSLNINDTDIPFPSLSKLIKESNLMGYKVKYNITEDFYFMNAFSNTNKIIKLYPYNISEEIDYNIKNLNPIIIANKNIYILDNDDTEDIN
jgi:hypothetical protein